MYQWPTSFFIGRWYSILWIDLHLILFSQRLINGVRVVPWFDYEQCCQEHFYTRCVCVQIFLSFLEWSFSWSSFLAELGFCQRFSLLHCEEGWESNTLTRSIIACAALETPDLLSKFLKTLFNAWVSYTNQKLMTWSRMSRWVWISFQPPTGHVASLPLTQWGQPRPFTPAC